MSDEIDEGEESGTDGGGAEQEGEPTPCGKGMCLARIDNNNLCGKSCSLPQNHSSEIHICSNGHKFV